MPQLDQNTFKPLALGAYAHPGAAKSVPQSATVFAELAQGLMENYTRFMTELSQSGMSLLAQGQDALLKAGAEPGRRGG